MSIQVNRKMASATSIGYALYEDGYYKLGEGFFSQVYAHPDKPNEVVKVTITDNLSWEYLDGWLRYFFGFIMVDEAYQSPHTPIVYDITFYDDGYAARMERLVHVSANEYWAAMQLPIVRDITNYGHGMTDLHQANVMKRVHDSWECIVITDPYA